MNTDELFSALGLDKPKPQTTATDSCESGTEFIDSAPAVTRDTEFAVCKDRWTERKGEEYVAEAPTGESARVQEKTAADIFAACFEFEPTMLEGCSRETWAQYMGAIIQSPEFHALRVETRLDEIKTVQSMGRIAAGYREFLKAKQKQKGNSPGDGDGEGAEGLSQGLGESGDQEAVEAAGKALGKATEDCETMSDLENALGGESMGGSGPVPGQRVDRGVLLKAFKKVSRNESLRKKFELAGRLREVAAAKQRAKKRAGIDEVIGMELGNEVAKLLAGELARIGDEDLELDFLRRFVDRQTLQRHHIGSEKSAQGPVVCIVDESGSMCGSKEIHAKALALTLGWVAQHQRRWYCLSSFSGGTCGKYLVCAPGKEPVWYECPEDSYDESMGMYVAGQFREHGRGAEATLDFLDHFYSGGSSLDLPLDILPQVWGQIGAPTGKTDIVMITDCHLRAPSKIGEVWNEFRARERARVQVYVVGEHTRKKGHGELKKIISEYCDELVICPGDVANPESAAALQILETV